MRRDIRGNANVPPSVPEEPSSAAAQLAQFPSMRRDPNYASKLQLPNGQPGGGSDWNRSGGGHALGQQQQYLGAGGNGDHQALPPPAFQNGNSVVNPINVHTDLSPHQFR